MRRKYASWGEFLKKKRQEYYRSAREFCTRLQLGISYPQYSRYEAGEQLPSLEQALKICDLLSIPLLEGILEWSRAQLTEAKLVNELESYLSQMRTAGSVGLDLPKGKVRVVEGGPGVNQEKPVSTLFTQSSKLNDILVFNSSHLRLFEKNQAYRDLFTLVNSCAPQWVEMKSVAKSAKLPLSDVETMLSQLAELGVVAIEGDCVRSAKKVFYFPDDPEFFRMRNRNIEHNTQQVLQQLTFEDLQGKAAFRSVITRDLSPDQVGSVVAQLETLLGQVAALPEAYNPEQIYSLCLVLGRRFERPRKAKKKMRISSIPSLDREGGLTLNNHHPSNAGRVQNVDSTVSVSEKPI